MYIIIAKAFELSSNSGKIGQLMIIFMIWTFLPIIPKSIYIAEKYLPSISRPILDLTGLDMLLLVASHPSSEPAHSLGRQGDSNLATTSEGGVTAMVVDTIEVFGMLGQWDSLSKANSACELLIVQYTFGSGSPKIEILNIHSAGWSTVKIIILRKRNALVVN